MMSLSLLDITRHKGNTEAVIKEFTLKSSVSEKVSPASEKQLFTLAASILNKPLFSYIFMTLETPQGPIFVFKLHFMVSHCFTIRSNKWDLV